MFKGVKMFDNINRPKHYNQGRIEPIEVIEDWEVGYHLGNVIKYIARAKYKGNMVEDLKKARWYLDRYINLITNKVIPFLLFNKRK